MSRSTRAGVGLLIFFASLPLQWQELARTPVGVVRWFHLGALVLLVLAPPSRGTWATLRRLSSPLVGMLAVLTLLLTATAIAFGREWPQPVQNWAYALIGLVVGCAMLTALREERGRRLVCLAAPVAVASFAVVFGGELIAAGIGPSRIVGAVTSANPSVVLLGFFRVVFHATSPDIPVQTRHEVFAALIVAACVTWAGRPRRGRRVLAVMGTGAVVVLLTLSLSRAVMLAACAVPLLLCLRFLRRNYLSLPALFGLLAAVGASPWLVPILWRLLESRFVEETGSYEARAGAFDVPGSEVGERVIFGGPELAMSTHTMVLDATLLGGVLTGLVALVVVAVFAWRGWVTGAAYVRSGVGLVAPALWALVLVRAFTEGGGLLHLAEWSAVGCALAYEARTRETAPTAEVADGAVTVQRAGLARVPDEVRRDAAREDEEAA